MRRASAILSVLSLFVILLASATAWADEAKPAPPAKKAPVEVHGDTVEYFHEEQKVIGTGHVKIDYEGVQLTADKITVYMASKTAVAEGNVVLTQKGSQFKGDRGEYNFDTKVGKVDKMSAFVEPSLYGKAAQIEKVSPDHYRATDSYVTTCCGDNPFYRVQGHQVDIYPGDRVVVRNAMLVVRGVPILFIPYFSQKLYDFDRFPVQLVPGKNSEWGAFLLSRWRYELVNTPTTQSKGNILADYRSKRGFGGGVENFYRGPKIGRGAVRLYYAHDQEPPDRADEERYRGQWRQQTRVAKDTTLTVEMNKWSDPTIIKDFFFREEYERNVFPDNYVSLITTKPEYTLSFLDRERIDDFLNVVERSPEIRFDTHTRQFVDTPFYLRQEAQFTNLKKEFADSELQEDALRFYTNQTLYYAGHVGDLSVTPRVGTTQTFYSRERESGEDHGRGTIDPGVDVSTRYFRTYDVYINSFGLDYNQIRHVFSPTASYNFRPNPTVSRTVLSQFDAIDALDKQNYMRFQFQNKLQTKQHTPDRASLYVREIARVVPFFDYDFDTGRLDNVGIDVETRPYTWLGIESDASYDTRTGQVQTANFDVVFDWGPTGVTLGQRYVREESTQTTIDARWKINEEWALKVYERYEFEEDHSEEFEATVSKTFDCLIVDFTYNHRRAEGDTFFVLFRLKGYPTASFGLSQSYSQPKAQPGRT